MQISVIIPVYNISIADLSRCVYSILNQSFSDFEIIIVDDGSRLEIADCLNEFERYDKRIRILHKTNEGVSAARNYGVANANGEYIMFVDGDDILTPWALEQGMTALIDTDTDIAIGRVYQTDIYPDGFPDKNVSANVQMLKNVQDRLEFECHIYLKNVNKWGRDKNGWMFNPEGCWAHLLKREVAETIPFTNGISVAEDTIWAVDLLRSERQYTICLVDDLWYYYIQNEDSVLHRYSPNLGDMISKAVIKLNLLYEYESNTTLYNAYLQWILSKLKQIVTRVYLHPNCKMKNGEKRKQMKIMLCSEAWSSVLKPRKDAYRSYIIKLFLYRSNLMLFILNLRNKVKGV